MRDLEQPLFQEATLYLGSLVCLRNRQTDAPWTNGEPLKSEGFFWKETSHIFLPQCRCPSKKITLKTLSHNQQMLLGKWKESPFMRTSPRSNKKVIGRIGELTHKLLPQKKNKGECHGELSEEENTKTLNVHSTLHLPLYNSELISELRIIERNKQ